MAVSENVLADVALFVGFESTHLPRLPAGDAALVARMQAGERAAFEEFIATYQDMVYGLVYRLLGDREDARDVAQETFLRAYRAIGGFRGEAGLKTWLYRMAVNQVSNHRRWWRRRRKAETVSLDDTLASGATVGERLASCGRSPEQQAIGRDQEARLLGALAELRHDYRAAIVLRDVEELSYEEVSEALGVPIGTVKSRIARAREELRRRVREIGI